MVVNQRVDKEYIDASHERCRKLGLDPNSVFSAKLLAGEEFQKRLDKRKELIMAATPFMNHLYNFVKGADFFVLITDEEGCILTAMGDDGILSEAFELKMIPGAFMNEESIGTNAMSVVISEQCPVQVSGKEHYINAYYRWTCSAAPIRDINGETIGILDLTGYRENVHPHTLGMVTAAANAIEEMLQINKYNMDLAIEKSSTESIYNSISDGMLLSDFSGNILSMNTAARVMFGNPAGELTNLKMWEEVDGWSNVIEELHTKGSFVDEDIYINSEKTKLQHTLTAYPIYDEHKNIMNIMHVFSELKKGRKLAGKIMSKPANFTFEKIIGRSDQLLECVEKAKKMAEGKSVILLTGESGTGKGIIAQSIHNFSREKEEPFITVNCEAIPKTHIEAELFGYESGAYTSVRRGGAIGKLELAEGGTLFIDEISEMPCDVQIKLLRVIEDGVFHRLGNETPIPVNVRIIAATNKDLGRKVEKGCFIKALFDQLKKQEIPIPPLRERREDVQLLIDYYMNKTSKRLNQKMVYISNEQMNQLMNYSWPGNVRELENVIECTVYNEVVPRELIGGEVKEGEKPANYDSSLTLDEVEKNHIIKVLTEQDGNIRFAAQSLGIGRNTLYRKLEKYGIEVPN